jgi:pimeloyl-ACP methyl ester carboxylesterase
MAALLCTSAGCTTLLPSMMINAPNSIKPLVGTIHALPAAQRVLGIDEHFRVDVGPPDASLAVTIIDPAAGENIRGTIFVLHGVGAKSFYMLGTGRELASAGYRAVLVDLRGHGGSSGRWLTYGVRESKDLGQVLAELDRRGLIEGEVGIFGISYGATTGLLFAAAEPRVKAVVAVAPFASMRDEVPSYLRTALPGVGHLMSDETVQEIVDEAGRQANFNPDDSDVAAAMPYVCAKVLLIHGESDLVIPKSQSEKIHSAAPEKSELAILPRLGHVLIFADPFGEVEERMLDWFDRHMGS